MTAAAKLSRDIALPQLDLPFGVEISAAGLECPQTLSDSQIIELGRMLRGIEIATPWWIADFILFCQGLFSDKKKPRKSVQETYDRVLKMWPEYSRAELRNLASIARRVPRDIRSNQLSFDHHRYVATLADEPKARELQAHYIKTAEETEASAEELRLMIANTARGRAFDPAPEHGSKTSALKERGHISASAGDLDEAERSEESMGLRANAPRAREQSALQDSHAQLTGEAHRALVRLRDWYAAEARRQSIDQWPAMRRDVLLHDLEPIRGEMLKVADLIGRLSGEFEQ